MKIKNSVIMALSEMIDAMEISRDILRVEGETDKDVGKEIIGLIFSKLHKAKKQYYDFVIEFKEIKIEEENLTKEEIYNKKIEIVENMDAVELFKELFDLDGVSDFLF